MTMLLSILFSLNTLLSAEEVCIPEQEFARLPTSPILELLGTTRDQGATGFCYAYSAADLMEYNLKKNGQLKKAEQLSGPKMCQETVRRITVLIKA